MINLDLVSESICFNILIMDSLNVVVLFIVDGDRFKAVAYCTLLNLTIKTTEKFLASKIWPVESRFPTIFGTHLISP